MRGLKGAAHPEGIREQVDEAIDASIKFARSIYSHCCKERHPLWMPPPGPGMCDGYTSFAEAPYTSGKPRG